MRLLNCSDVKIRTLITEGELKFEQKGRQKFFEQSEVYRVAKKLAEEYKNRMTKEL